MAAPATSSIQRVPGSLVWNPTDLGASAPFGGTYLGETRMQRWMPHPRYYDVYDEEFGTITSSLFLGHGKCELSAILRYPDGDAIGAAAPNSANSGSVGYRWFWTTTATTRAGTALGTGKLLFVPHAVNAHDMIVIYAATARIHEDAELRMAWGEEYGLGIQFVGTPDGTGRVFNVGRRGAITL